MDCEWKRASPPSRDTCGAFSGCMFTGFSNLAILLSFPSVPSFRINNYDPLLLFPFLLDSTALILVAGLAFRATVEVFNEVFSIFSPSCNSRIRTVVPALAGLSPHFNKCNVGNYKAIHFQSIKVILLFCILSFTASLKNSTWFTILARKTRLV